MTRRVASPVDVHVGKRVRQARLLIDMSQEKLGDALKLTFQQVQKYEKGTNRISCSKLQEISIILQRPVSWFFEGIAAQGDLVPAGDDPMMDLATSREGMELAKAWNAIVDNKIRLGLLHTIQATAAATNADYAASQG